MTGNQKYWIFHDDQNCQRKESKLELRADNRGSSCVNMMPPGNAFIAFDLSRI
jgi:hypothetical protein